MIGNASYYFFSFKPIFYWKLGLRWPPNANEINNKKRNVHCQRDNFALGTQCNLYSTDSPWGFLLGVTQILGLALGETQI